MSMYMTVFWCQVPLYFYKLYYIDTPEGVRLVVILIPYVVLEELQ